MHLRWGSYAYGIAYGIAYGPGPVFFLGALQRAGGPQGVGRGGPVAPPARRPHAGHIYIYR